MPSRIVPSSSAVARTWLAVPPSRSAAVAPRWRSCQAAPPRLRPLTRSPGWVCGRRCRESLHLSSSAVVRPVASGQRTAEHRRAQQLLRCSALCPAVPRRWDPAAGGAEQGRGRGGAAQQLRHLGPPAADLRCSGSMGELRAKYGPRRSCLVLRDSAPPTADVSRDACSGGAAGATRRSKRLKALWAADSDGATGRTGRRSSTTLEAGHVGGTVTSDY